MAVGYKCSHFPKVPLLLLNVWPNIAITKTNSVVCELLFFFFFVRWGHPSHRWGVQVCCCYIMLISMWTQGEILFIGHFERRIRLWYFKELRFYIYDIIIYINCSLNFAWPCLQYILVYSPLVIKGLSVKAIKQSKNYEWAQVMFLIL